MTKKLLGVKMEPEKKAEFERNCRWFGDPNVSAVVVKLVDAFISACQKQRAGKKFIVQPFTLCTGELNDDEKAKYR